MGAGRSDFKSVARCEFRQLAAKMDHLAPRTASIVTNFRAELHHGLMHLRLDLLFQNYFAVGENLLNVRTQLPRLGINDLEFFLNPESEDVIALVHSPKG